MDSKLKSMDPDRLTSIREGVEWRRDRQQPGDDDRDVIIAELLADRDYQAQRADAAEANYRFMVEQAAGGGRLDGYRELGQRAADAERQRDEARAEVCRLLSGLAEIFDWVPESVTVDTTLRSVREHKKHGAAGWHRAELAGEEYRRAVAERDEARRILAEIADVLTVDAHEPPESRESIPAIVASLVSSLHGKDEFIERSERFRLAAEAEVARLRSRAEHAERLLRGEMTPEHQEALDVDHPQAWIDLALMRGVEVRRLRSRVRVNKQDASESNICPAQALAWASAHGWERLRTGRRLSGLTTAVVRKRDAEARIPLMADAVDYHAALAIAVRDLADVEGRPGLDILDEMARMPTDTSPG